jgi:hypothetical protein
MAVSLFIESLSKTRLFFRRRLVVGVIFKYSQPPSWVSEDTDRGKRKLSFTGRFTDGLNRRDSDQVYTGFVEFGTRPKAVVSKRTAFTKPACVRLKSTI